MRNPLAITLLVGMTAFALAQDPKSGQEKKGESVPAAKIKPVQAPPKAAVPITLKPGDAAPALRADKWFQGAEIKGFEPGKIYVVEFWATWCGPCIVMMPHLGELQNEYRDKGVTIIGYSSKDPNNSMEKVAEFVAKRGPQLGYTFAYEDSREVNTAWMKAAGQNGIPCTFVVNQDGKIAYIGHPMFLDVVLPRILDKTWTEDDVKNGSDRLRKIYTNASQALSNKDVEEASKTYAEIEKANPWLVNVPYLTGSRLGLLVRAKKFDELKAAIEELTKKATKQNNPSLLSYASMALRDPSIKEQKDLLQLAVHVAESTVKLESDPKSTAHIMAKSNLAMAHHQAGNINLAKEMASKLLEDAPANLKRSLELRLKPILGDENPAKKDSE